MKAALAIALTVHVAAAAGLDLARRQWRRVAVVGRSPQPVELAPIPPAAGLATTTPTSGGAPASGATAAPPSAAPPPRRRVTGTPAAAASEPRPVRASSAAAPPATRIGDRLVAAVQPSLAGAVGGGGVGRPESTTGRSGDDAGGSGSATGRGGASGSGSAGGHGGGGAKAPLVDPGDDGAATRRAIRSRIETRRRYPELARRRGIEGTVRLRFSIQPDGRVERVELLAGVDPLLDEAAREAVFDAAPLPWLAGPIEIELRYRLSGTDVD